MFNERVVVGPQKSFSHSDLLEYVESLLKESKLNEDRSLRQSNYSWLKSRGLEAPTFSQELEELTPVVVKMTSQSCAVIAVKLDILTKHVKPSNEILKAFKNLLEEQYSIQLLEETVKRAKGMKNSKNRRNKVHPELMPPGRQPTVSFILYQ